MASDFQSENKLSESYKKEIITLIPPLREYRGLSFHVDQKLIGDKNFKGLRVDINSPYDHPRKLGDHPSAVVYYFNSSKSVMISYDAAGNELLRRVISGQLEHQVEYDISFIRCHKK
jgi:hypothetical protein